MARHRPPGAQSRLHLVKLSSAQLSCTGSILDRAVSQQGRLEADASAQAAVLVFFPETCACLRPAKSKSLSGQPGRAPRVPQTHHTTALCTALATGGITPVVLGFSHAAKLVVCLAVIMHLPVLLPGNSTLMRPR